MLLICLNLRRSAEVEINEVTGQIIDSAMKVHSAVGPGLLEGVYEACVRHELTRRGLEVKSQALLCVPQRPLR